MFFLRYFQLIFHHYIFFKVDIYKTFLLFFLVGWGKMLDMISSNYTINTCYLSHCLRVVTVLRAVENDFGLLPFFTFINKSLFNISVYIY